MSSGSDPTDGGGRRPYGSLDDVDARGSAWRAERIAFYELGEADAEALRAYRPIAEAAVDGIVARFYEHLLSFPELETLLREKPDRIVTLKAKQRAHFLSIMEGRFDTEFFESRLRVGDAHQRIGLRPNWYIGAFALFLRLAMRELVAATGDGQKILPTLEAIVKAVCLDMSLAIDTYIYGGFVNREAAGRMEEAREVAEDALRARDEVERLKNDLTSMVVHDLKNPVNGIAMMAQLALRKGQDLPSAHRNYLQQIERTCREMMRLIQNLLEITKIEEGKMPVAREVIVLAELADEVAHEYRIAAEQSGRRLEIAVDTTLPPAVADRALLKRVIVNLIVNAIRHSGSTDVVVEASTGPGPGELTLRVVDHGRGIAPEDQPRIFEKFRTVRRSATDDPAGDTGLGLSFCKLAVERMGGQIALTSTAQMGTVFAVTLPVRGA